MSALRLGASIRGISFGQFGQPAAVLKLDSTSTRQALGADDVRLKVLASPVHPSDLASIAGWVPSASGCSPHRTAAPSAAQPWIGGSEGVAEVVEAGAKSAVAVGSKVVVRRPTPMWTEEAVVPAAHVWQVPQSLATAEKLDYAAMLTVAPSCAYRLLADNAAALQKGDVIIQNAGNSAVAQSVMQLAAERGIRTVSIVRDRPNGADTIERLKAYGAHLVVTDSYLRKPEFRRLVADLPKPKLALDAVGGPSATEMARLLAPRGTLVSYGCLSRKPVQLPSSLFYLNEIVVKGFSLSRWYAESPAAAQDELWSYLAKLVDEQRLRLWIERHKATHFARAIERTRMQIDRKILLDFADY